jgi:hypothetical protein
MEPFYRKPIEDLALAEEIMPIFQARLALEAVRLQRRTVQELRRIVHSLRRIEAL